MATNGIAYTIIMKEISPIELKSLMERHDDIHLIDVREPWEREIFHIGGEHIPLTELISRNVSLERERQTILYCEKGIRSAIAIQRLEMLGFTNLYNLAGGMKAWKKEFGDQPV